MITFRATANYDAIRFFYIARHIIGRGRLHTVSVKTKRQNKSTFPSCTWSLKWEQLGLSISHLQHGIALKCSEECVIRQMILSRTSSPEGCKVSKVIIFYCWSYWKKKKTIHLNTYTS